MKKTAESKNFKNLCNVCSAMWIGVSLAVIVGLIATQNPLCLLAFIIPANAKLSFKDESGEENRKQFSDKW